MHAMNETNIKGHFLNHQSLSYVAKNIGLSVCKQEFLLSLIFIARISQSLSPHANILLRAKFG